MFAMINDHMMAIRSNLGSNPAVASATRGCDIRRYQGSMREEAVYSFEAYVEAATHTGEIFCWQLDVNFTSHGWEFQRSISRQTSGGGQPEKGFEDLAFEDFGSLADSCGSLMIEFAESAKNFDFRH